jgi:hypothetical protein
LPIISSGLNVFFGITRLLKISLALSSCLDLF